MLILHNANIITQDSKQPRASALAIEGEKIIAVGENEDVLALATAGTSIQNLNGATLMPGLTDAHIHLQTYAHFLQIVPCETPTRSECLRRIADRAAQTPPGDWILGHGWNHNEWPEGLGTAADLDAVSPHNPVYLTAKSLHAGWANSRALEIAGLSNDSPDPLDGKLGRTPSAQLDGILYESSAMNLVASSIPQLTAQQNSDAIQQAIPQLWKMGLTGCHDFDPFSCLTALQDLHANQLLKFRVVKGIPHSNFQQAIDMGLYTGSGDHTLRIGSVKLFADGALGPRTAAMVQPYQGTTDDCGFPLLTADQVYEMGQKAVTARFSLAIHAIGDKANREVLNGYAHLRTFEKEVHLQPLSHRIEHVQILQPDDLGRLAELGIIASMQPIHATSDMYTADRLWGSRAAFSYAWHSLADASTLLIFGSDAPVESPNPFWGLHAAVTRQRHNGEPGLHGWYPEQRLNLVASLEAYSINPAQVAGMDHILGRLSPGYYADLLVLNRDPFSVPSTDLFKLSPSSVMVAGEWVFQS